VQGELSLTAEANTQAVETILEKYQEIFVEEDDGGDTATPAA
jgi:hypothetical protein